MAAIIHFEGLATVVKSTADPAYQYLQLEVTFSCATLFSQIFLSR